MDDIEEVPATAPPAAPSSVSPPPPPTPKKKKVKEIAKRIKWGLKNVARVLKGRRPRDRELQDVSN